MKVNVFEADIRQFRIQETYDVVFSTGTFHYIPTELRHEIMASYIEHTTQSGLHALSVFVRKPFIPKAPDAESVANHWKTGELFTYYHDWQIEFCTEEIIDCNSCAIPHRHAINPIIARKV